MGADSYTSHLYSGLLTFGCISIVSIHVYVMLTYVDSG